MIDAVCPSVRLSVTMPRHALYMHNSERAISRPCLQRLDLLDDAREAWCEADRHALERVRVGRRGEGERVLRASVMTVRSGRTMVLPGCSSSRNAQSTSATLMKTELFATWRGELSYTTHITASRNRTVAVGSRCP